MRVAAILGAFTVGSLRGPIEIAVGCAAVLLAEWLALLALVPENPPARMAARGALVVGGLALVPAVFVSNGYWRVSLDPSVVSRYAGAYQVAAICATGGGWLLAVLTAFGLVWGALVVVAPPLPDGADSSPARDAADTQQPLWQPTPSRWDTRRAALAQARLWLWPWLDLYAALYVVSLAVAIIRIQRTSGLALLSASDLVASFGPSVGLMMWMLLIGTFTYRNMRLARRPVVGVLAVASLLTLAQIGVDVVRIMTF